MDTAVTRVERTENRNTRITSTAKTRPSRPSVVSPSMDCSTNGAWSNTTVSLAPSPRAAARSGSLSRTACETSTALPSGVTVMDTPRLSLPSVRVIEVCAAVVGSIVATSPSRTAAGAPVRPPGAVVPVAVGVR